MTNTQQPKTITFQEKLKVLLVSILSVIGLTILLGNLFSEGVAQPFTPTLVISQPQQATIELQARKARALAGLDELESHIHCPGFFDAPLGNKPCPAQEVIDHARELINKAE